MRGRSGSNTSSGVDWVRAVSVSGEAERSGSIAGKRQWGRWSRGWATSRRFVGFVAQREQPRLAIPSGLLHKLYSHFNRMTQSWDERRSESC
jgi:hypothetical protein